ncbi:MAG TPA: hypothetical protein VHU42_08245 [Rhodopila sp.]|jgi:hypothetical protein|nr:hypothetical protein [Rhodopila sp.]
MPSLLADLHDAVAHETTVEGSAVALVHGVIEHIRQALRSGNPAAMGDLTEHLATQSGTLAQSVVANTPAEPVPVAPPMPQHHKAPSEADSTFNETVPPPPAAATASEVTPPSAPPANTDTGA